MANVLNAVVEILRKTRGCLVFFVLWILEIFRGQNDLSVVVSTTDHPFLVKMPECTGILSR